MLFLSFLSTIELTALIEPVRFNLAFSILRPKAAIIPKAIWQIVFSLVLFLVVK